MFKNASPEDVAKYSALLKQAGSANLVEQSKAMAALATAVTLPLRSGILVGDNIGGIFDIQKFDPNVQPEYPIDLFRPDNAADFTAYTIPNQGRIPERTIESDKVRVPIFDVGNSIDWLIKYARDTRWDIVGRAMEVLEAGFVKKRNDDAWHVIMAAGFDRNLMVNDTNAAAGQFTKRLVSLLQLVMRRNAGGNATSLNRGRLTHIFLSPEAMADIRNWDATEVDEVTRREIYISNDEGASEIFGVKLVVLDELGEGQEYQKYYQQIIAAGAANNGMASGDVEIVIGLDASTNDSFIMPVQEEIQVFEDPALHRSRRQGFYSWCAYGVAVLNSQRVLLGSL